MIAITQEMQNNLNQFVFLSYNKKYKRSLGLSVKYTNVI